ncbi:MAG TPA: right-handed parallel beta-helix repeat-containing protein [Chthoniobacteraceae bacterium]|nr:right-handed parallel beta-helix repeat-containing protein [Chthoniobacteraceae bacterium]
MKSGLRLLCLLLLLLPVVGVIGADSPSGEAVVYVSPEGSDQADGTAQAPVASVEKAIALLADGGTVILREGVYRQAVTVPESTGDAPLTIRAEEGRRVIFDGGRPMEGWKPFGSTPSLYVAPLPAVDPVTDAPLTPQSVHLWDRSRRVRFIRAADEAGVRAWPGSFCVLEGGNVLLHLPDGREPGRSVECNRFSKGLVVLRGGVALKGLRFRNYFFNHYSAAISIGAVRGVEMTDCRIDNALKGISIAPLAEKVRIVRTHLRDVGTGIANSGNDITVEDCLIEAASGRFAIAEIASALRCAIRLYHPGIGAVVRRNVTAGFWAGLRIKTAVNLEARAELAQLPFIIENNTFTDGVSMTPGSRDKLNGVDRFVGNLYAARGEDSGMEKLLQEHGVVVEGNDRYAPSNPVVAAAEGEEEVLSPMPFVDAAGGDLELSESVKKRLGGREVGSPHRAVEWAPEIAAWLASTGPDGTQEAAGADAKARPVKREGKQAVTLHVAANADAAAADGSAEHPYPRLQMALDQVLPGDTVLLAPGVYTDPAILRRSGTAQAPITIRGGDATTTILDGGRHRKTLLSLQGAEEVRIEGLQFRWFTDAGLRLEKARAVTITRCRFFNAEIAAPGASIGNGIFAADSPGLTITHCITSRNKVGFKLIGSPGATIRNNTAFKNLNTALELVRSSRGTTITYNSFGFSSHAAIYFWEHDPDALASLVCDYNNFANRLYDYLKYSPNRKSTPELEILPIPERYGRVAGGKAVVDHLDSYADDRPRNRYHRLSEWQEASGKDAHSLFADPQYAAPLEGDFHLLKGSPNLLADGKVIGAEGARQKR